MAKGKLRNYLVYAIGEIILVVVGILIALQINNWNLQKRADQTELSILHELQSNLEIDSAAYSRTNTFLRSKLDLLGDIKSYLDSDLAYNDTLAKSFGMISLMASVSPNKSAFERLSDFGVDNVKNDSIRIYILRYYSIADHLSKTSQEYNFGIYFRDKIYPKHFKNFSYAGGAEPQDYESLKKANDFRVALDYVGNDSNYFLYGYSSVLETNEKLRKFIQDEISARS